MCISCDLKENAAVKVLPVSIFRYDAKVSRTGAETIAIQLFKFTKSSRKS
ncbi:hypothetical protein CUS_8059 [Ruminococcus albus 8]|uniref:Uncharacterized protein n=1 Tax=Ruminococcus albus 8 TaxID=246199 RepID=E9SAU6_RUMAL|nr:hypothetical protein CUS_8059 [Ruminococcus albus 8]